MTPPKKPAVPASTSDTLRVNEKLDGNQSAATARIALRPSVRAGVTTRAFSKHFGDVDLTALVDELAEQNRAVSKGDMARVEGMLMSQAHTLEAIFNELARRAALNMGEYLDATDTYMRLGLKAQSQCRATLETLATIRNPAPVTFVKQANVAHGPQQVNNGDPPGTKPSPARESGNRPNKLSEQQHGEGLDTRALRASVNTDTSLEAVGTFNGTKNDAR